VGPLSAHLFGLSLNFDLGTMASSMPVFGRTALVIGYERYFNSNNYSADFLETGLDFRF